MGGVGSQGKSQAYHRDGHGPRGGAGRRGRSAQVNRDGAEDEPVLSTVMTTSTPRALSAESGFSLLELMVTSGILMAVSAIVMNGVFQMTTLNNTTTNRAQMFAGVRNAT